MTQVSRLVLYLTHIINDGDIDLDDILALLSSAVLPSLPTPPGEEST